MSAVLERPPQAESTPRPRGARALPGPPLIWPTVVAALSALAFCLVRPNVGDLQAALARASAASSGVGLGYWFRWFGGGATPGSYSVLTPYVSALLGATIAGGLATVAVVPLAYRAMRGTPHQLAATWVALVSTGLSLWSGRIPFALGLAAALVAIVAVRERQALLAVVAIVVSTLFSPVSGVFLVFGLGAAFLVERDHRKLIFWVCAACGATLLAILIIFGGSGPQPYSIASALLWGSGLSLVMLLARPVAGLRVVLVCTAVLAPLLALIPNAMGSNVNRLTEVCLPAAVLATAAVRDRRVLAVAMFFPLAMGVAVTTRDLVRSGDASARTSYYAALIQQLDRAPDLDNYRLEVVQDPNIHTGAYVLAEHVALAGGYETQEQNALNPILSDPKNLNATSYKIWLDNNAVGYLAFSRNSGSGPEYQLVKAGLPYLQAYSSDPNWILYRVVHPNVIVAAPLRLVTATQAAMTIDAPLTGKYHVRVRYSKFLTAKIKSSGSTAKVSDDGSGWTLLTVTVPGRYVLSG